MTNYYITNAIVGTEDSKPDPANPAGNSENPNYPLFIAGDTGKIYKSTGKAWEEIAPLGLGINQANGDLKLADSVSLELSATSVILCDGDFAVQTNYAGGLSGIAIGADTAGNITLGFNGQVLFNADGTGQIAGAFFEWDAAGNIGVANQNIPANGGIATTQLKFNPTAATGAPTTGTHEKGEMLMDAAGNILVCQDGGTPGTWKQATLA